MCFHSKCVIHKWDGFHFFAPINSVVWELVITSGGMFEGKSPLQFLYFNFVGFFCENNLYY